MFSTEQSLLLVIDVQGKLFEMMHHRGHLTHVIPRLVQAARLLDVPVLHTEQAPDKIGPTVDSIASLMNGQRPIIKRTFSCCRNPEFTEILSFHHRSQIVVAGIEAHVCVYQTVADLLERGFKVQVVTDAVSSRHEHCVEIGLKRMEEAGAQMSCGEMIICEWMKSADHPKFRDVMKLIK